MSTLQVPDADERADLGVFVARVVRLDSAAPVRLVAAPGRTGTVVTAWADTPFGVLVTRSAHGRLEPADLTVGASGLLTALSVQRGSTLDLGQGGPWPGELPPADGWEVLERVPADELDGLAERGLTVARENAGPRGLPTALLDQAVLTVSGPGPGPGPGPAPPVRVPLRCLFALSGMGLLGGQGATVRVSARRGWLRLDARHGAVVHRRIVTLPLVVT